MLKGIVTVSVLASATLLMAGGSVKASLPSVVEVPTHSAKTDPVYVEKDVQLMWQDQAYTDAEDGANKQRRSIEKSGKWRHAEQYCSSLDYAGYIDWRLPTSDELQHVHQKAGQVFTHFRGSDFWTSTPASKRKYFVVFTADAYRYERKLTQTNYIRCVREIK